MQFTFPGGEVVSIPVGHKLVGFTRAGRRPSSVTLDRKELLWLKKNYSYHRLLEQALELDAASIKEAVKRIMEDRQPLVRRQSGGFAGD